MKGSARFVSYLLVALTAECCFAGISVELRHVHGERAFHRLPIRAARHAREMPSGNTRGQAEQKISETFSGRTGEIMKGIKRRL